MDNNLLESLTSRYRNVPNANKFIIACFVIFDEEQPKKIKNFINSIFSNNQLHDCEYQTIAKLSAHFWNIAKTKIEQDDYRGHIYSSVTASKLRCIARFMEKND